MASNDRASDASSELPRASSSKSRSPSATLRVARCRRVTERLTPVAMIQAPAAAITASGRKITSP